jgi:hypothetical protein
MWRDWGIHNEIDIKRQNMRFWTDRSGWEQDLRKGSCEYRCKPVSSMNVVQVVDQSFDLQIPHEYEGTDKAPLVFVSFKFTAFHIFDF